MSTFAASTAELVGELGEAATIVQISSGFCAPCRAARTVMSRVVDHAPGVRYAEIDLAYHPEQAELLGVIETPMIFTLDAAGEIVSRQVGVPRLAAAKAHIALVTQAPRERATGEQEAE